MQDARLGDACKWSTLISGGFLTKHTGISATSFRKQF
jgi:hypothetical protein